MLDKSHIIAFVFILVLEEIFFFHYCFHFSLLYLYFFIHSPLSSVSMLVCCRALSGDAQPNRILLVTVHHMLYPITVEVLHQVFFPHGFVEKIVTFQKSAGQLLQVFFLFLSQSIPLSL